MEVVVFAGMLGVQTECVSLLISMCVDTLVADLLLSVSSKTPELSNRPEPSVCASIRGGPIDQDMMDFGLVHSVIVCNLVLTLAILRLAEIGSLELDDPVVTILPYFIPTAVFGPAATAVGNKITIRQLLAHKSGLGCGKTSTGSMDMVDEIYDSFGFTLSQMPSILTPNDSQENRKLQAGTRCLALLPLKFQPGESFSFSIGHLVLADVIETVCNTQLDAAIQSLVYTPVGIDSFPLSAPDLDKLLRVVDPEDSNGSNLISRPTLESALIAEAACDTNNIISGCDWCLLGPMKDNALWLANCCPPTQSHPTVSDRIEPKAHRQLTHRPHSRLVVFLTSNSCLDWVDSVSDCLKSALAS